MHGNVTVLATGHIKKVEKIKMTWYTSAFTSYHSVGLAVEICGTSMNRSLEMRCVSNYGGVSCSPPKGPLQWLMLLVLLLQLLLLTIHSTPTSTSTAAACFYLHCHTATFTATEYRKPTVGVLT